MLAGWLLELLLGLLLGLHPTSAGRDLRQLLRTLCFLAHVTKI